MFRNCSFSCKPCSRQAWTIICRPRRLLDTYRPHSNRPVMCLFATTLFGNPCSHPTMAHTQVLERTTHHFTVNINNRPQVINIQRFEASDCRRVTVSFIFCLNLQCLSFSSSLHSTISFVAFSVFFLFFFHREFFSPAKFTGGGAM